MLGFELVNVVSCIDIVCSLVESTLFPGPHGFSLTGKILLLSKDLRNLLLHARKEE